MQPKKSNRANLENRRLIFFQIGLIITLAFIIIAFEWGTTKTKLVKMPVLDDNGYDSDLIDIPSTHENMKKAEPPKPDFNLVIIPNLEPECPDINLPDIEVELGKTKIIIDVGDEKPEPMTIPIILSDEKPLFQGQEFEPAFRKFVYDHVKYPQEAVNYRITGKVFIEFIINEYGEITNIKIVRGVHPLLDDEALRVIKMAPKCTPGKQNSNPVRIKYTFPLVFKLNEGL